MKHEFDVFHQGKLEGSNGKQSFRSKLQQRKKKIAMRTWQKITYGLVGILVVSVIGLLWSYTASAEEEIENVTYYAVQEAKFNYRVYSLPNDLFSERVLGPGRAYLTSMTDYLSLELEYNFIGDREAEIIGQYGISARLAAMTSQEEHLVWEKTYELFPAQEFKASGSDYSISETVALPLSDYLAFVEQVREETGYNPAELNLIVTGNVNVKAETSEGVLTEELSPNMVIPMKGNAFTVKGELVDSKEGGITETQTVTAMTVSNARSVTPALVTVSAIALFLFRLLTVPSEDKGRKKAEQVSGILKKHKERIVVTANGVTSVPQEAITVYSFDELIKLADEVGKPILYPQPKAANGSEHIFLIYTPEKIYAYGLSESAGTSTQKE